ncbi:hypothetical protein HOP50_01g04220 [Chloropicon primus]|uniref:Uncharacterized protein n=1 Tax=Chloropicon primus TaxID=1764295 RepID=A0A5B8MBR5_9CHLO|nr:hypothetical protein A3770_01p04340 [Chloropicon primus]UPQ97131.1 hypothetical protein HOP50_01g04220 [Chloropicon primus]|eukprot:QDZ17916.1 hypothetical protein A3770_01p04340 [Chloropicon primus]
MKAGDEEEFSSLEEAAESPQLTFPAGLVPRLVALEESKGEQPLTKGDIDGELELAEKEEASQTEDDKSALAQKLQGFYAELHDRLWSCFDADGSPKVGAEGEAGDGAGESEEEPPEAPPARPLLPDRAGLGMRVEALDAYEAFRQERSGAYHSKIVKRKWFR